MKIFTVLYLSLIFICLPAHAQKRTCDYIKKPPLNVTINLDIPEASYDYNRPAQDMSDQHFEQTVAWLQKQGIKSVGMARHLGRFVSVRGLTSGGYGYSGRFMMRAQPVDRYGVYFCPYLTDITIDLFYATQIFIAREIPKDSCEFKETMKHEWKHHTANVMAIKTYSDRLKIDLQKIARDIELRHGYVDASKVPGKFKEIETAMNDMITIYYESINQNSHIRNAAIDTPAEYDRVDRAIELCEKERKG